ncbi:hypothetical protein NPIL_200011 [Nephila pilipes]|uniref:Phorbol-ester/DAG-type domain-containing protein n=1 Tax=Nephila pilipes TaxID=299642 RepID=A0A8X6MWU2_NEPPI|nr:hypothetical protein NPIL_200011 [Nephila pilipes]
MKLDQRPEESRHSFRTKTFRKDRVCDVCKLTIDYQGNSCKNCKYVCHKECEMKESQGLSFSILNVLRLGFVFLFFIVCRHTCALSLIRTPVVHKCETAEQSL